MNINGLDNRISIMTIKQTENAYEWVKCSCVWAKVEQMNGSNLFSKVGLGAKSIKFTIRKKNDLTLHNSFQWQGKHCFLTNIAGIDRMHCEVSAALIEPQACIILRTEKPTRNELNRPVYATPTTITFPACLTEKYLGHIQGTPMAHAETRYVLITPKVIELYPKELVQISNKRYKVLIPHTLDEHKNEYEILSEEDI